jgi:hypothetical protein
MSRKGWLFINLIVEGDEPEFAAMLRQEKLKRLLSILL